MTGTELHRLAEGEGTLYVDGVPLGGIREFSVGPIVARPQSVAAVSRSLGVPVDLLACSVEGCTSPDTFHHHHRALRTLRSPLACRCQHGPDAR